MTIERFEDADEVAAALTAADYLPDRALATAVLLATRLRRPLLVEGAPGVGKTELAKTLARVTGTPLIRLQCYEGIESSEALYEWDWARQLLTARAAGDGRAQVGELYAPEYLLERPLLRAINAAPDTVLLIDELDRADDEFDAFLLEVLSDFTVSIPELGTVAASEPPLVIVTSNRTRELHDALTRRCLYHWIDFPDVEREVQIIRLHAPDVSDELARSVAEAVSKLRAIDLVKVPGAAEAIDWAMALAVVGARSVTDDPRAAEETLGSVIKHRDDLRRVGPILPDLARG